MTAHTPIRATTAAHSEQPLASGVFPPNAPSPAGVASGEPGTHPYSRTCNCDACFDAWLAMPEPTPAERVASARAFSAALWPSGGGELLTDRPVTFPDLDADDARASDPELQVLARGGAEFQEGAKGMTKDKGASPSADERAMLADLTFVECHACRGTGVTTAGLYCVMCSGEGTIPEWSDGDE